MLFPIGDDNIKGGALPIVNYTFIVLNVLVFLYEASMSPDDLNSFIMNYGGIPVDLVHGERSYTILTSMFMHGGWMHLIGNMLFLWVFGDNIEATVGHLRYILFYLAGGLAATFAHAFMNPASTIPTVGASGAIAAVLGAYLVMYPRSRIKLLFIYFFQVFRIAAIWFLGIWIAQQLLSGIETIGPDINSGGVAWWAHIGGFIFGVVAGFIFRQQYQTDTLVLGNDDMLSYPEPRT